MKQNENGHYYRQNNMFGSKKKFCRNRLDIKKIKIICTKKGGSMLLQLETKLCKLQG